MTTNNPGSVTVEQVDRLAAAKLIGKIGLSWTGDMIRAGKSDDHDYVKAFARHRKQAIAALEEETKRLREAMHRYGQHDRTCTMMMRLGHPCHCGWSADRATLEGGGS